MKKIEVKAHFRNGNYVRAYERIRKNSTQGPPVVRPGRRTLLDISGSNAALVDRNGKIFELKTGRTLIENADFTGYSFKDLNLVDVIFRNVKMNNASFTNCAIHGSSIIDSDFSGVELQGSSLTLDSVTASSFRKTRFLDTTMSRDKGNMPTYRRTPKAPAVSQCDFSEARFENVDMERIEIAESDLQGATFVDSKTSHVIVQDSVAAGTVFDGCELEYSTFNNSDLSGALISRCNVSSAIGYWEKVNLNNARISESVLDGVKLTAFPENWLNFQAHSGLPYLERKWREWRARRQQLAIKKAAKKNMENLSIEKSTLKECSFKLLDMRKTKLVDSNFHDCRFEHVDVSNADWSRNTMLHANFIQVTARNLKAHETNFQKSVFTSNIFRCDFSGSDFTGADFSKTEIGNSILKNCNWTNATTTDLTVFPPHSIGQAAHSADATIESLTDTSYEHYSMAEAAKKMGATDKAFEFLVVSGVVDVRDNITKSRVTSGFNVDRHHIPVWQLQNLPSLQNETK